MPAGAYYPGITRDSWKSDQNKWTAKILSPSLPPPPLSLVITSESLAHSSRSTTRNHLESVVCSKTVTNRLETRLQLADFRHERERSIARFDRPIREEFADREVMSNADFLPSFPSFSFKSQEARSLPCTNGVQVAFSGDRG